MRFVEKVSQTRRGWGRGGLFDRTPLELYALELCSDPWAVGGLKRSRVKRYGLHTYDDLVGPNVSSKSAGGIIESLF